MEIASLIVATLALIVGIISLSWQLGKHWSTHSIQLQPVESLFNPMMGKKIGSELREFDEKSMDEAEQAYFDKHNKKTQAV